MLTYFLVTGAINTILVLLCSDGLTPLETIGILCSAFVLGFIVIPIQACLLILSVLGRNV